MHRNKIFMRLTACLLGGLVMLGVMGGPCDLTIFPEGIINFDSVTVELVNNTEYEVEPNLYVDPDEDVHSAASIVNAENYVDFLTPIQPGEIVHVTFDCDDIGSIVSDYAYLYISDLEMVESDNGPLLIEEEDFECGDIISFIFIDEWPDGIFFTRVEVNEEFLED